MAKQVRQPISFVNPRVLKAYVKLGRLLAILDAFWQGHQVALVAEPFDDGDVDETDGVFVQDDVGCLAESDLHDLLSYYEQLKELVEGKTEELLLLIAATAEAQEES